MLSFLKNEIWFRNFIAWCRGWGWFDRYIYGKPIDFEDFCRNPAEAFLDEVIGITDCKALVLFSVRLGFRRYRKENEPRYIVKVTDYYFHNRKKLAKQFAPAPLPNESEWINHYNRLGNNYAEQPSRRIPRIRIPGTDFVMIDCSWWDAFSTKYPNAALSVSGGFVYKKWIALPWINLTIRFLPDYYFQAGVGWCPRYKMANGTFSRGSAYGKMRIGSYGNEIRWNPGAEVFGWFEGQC